MVLDAVVSGGTFLIKELGVFAIGATVVGWVARDAITQHFDKELAKYQTEVDKELKRYQTELDKERTKFSELHNDRAKITAELYERFVELEEAMRKMTHPMEMGSDPPKKELREEAAEAGNEFINFYMRNKIYFPPEVCETVEELHTETKGVFDDWIVYSPDGEQPGKKSDPQKWFDLWDKVTEDEVPELKAELENHFRELLGVEIEEQK